MSHNIIITYVHSTDTIAAFLH